ncbi:hypothetical protein B0T19DRAFT_438507 [Cercophora scortea]|uniref:Uncharacterized protein n=1 Tax=Cercophora scortea TaxID=314031 RepID=A0AAE0IUN0_9PEZI|nr:hypothetical protein B0T19DRAFT_438507 [Cercophora scortea]
MASPFTHPECHIECISCRSFHTRENFHRLVMVSNGAAPVCNACAGPFQTPSPLTLPDPEDFLFQAVVDRAVQESIQEAIDDAELQATEFSRRMYDPRRGSGMSDMEEFEASMAVLDLALNSLQIGGGEYDDDSDSSSQNDGMSESESEYDMDTDMEDMSDETDAMNEDPICDRCGDGGALEYHVNPDVTLCNFCVLMVETVETDYLLRRRN